MEMRRVQVEGDTHRHLAREACPQGLVLSPQPRNELLVLFYGPLRALGIGIAIPIWRV